MSRVFQALAGLALLFAATVGNAELRTISAVYFRDALSFSVPYEAAHSGEAKLIGDWEKKYSTPIFTSGQNHVHAMRAHAGNNPEKAAAIFGRSEFGLPPLDLRF